MRPTDGLGLAIVLAALLACKQGRDADGREGSACSADADCRNGLACRAERCVPVAPAPLASPSPVAAPTPAPPPSAAPPPAPALGMLFDGPPQGRTLQRLVPLNRALPRDLLVWAPPGWKTFEQERYDDLLNAHAPDEKANVLINSGLGKVGDPGRKLWTESMSVRGATYGEWEAGTLGVERWPARVSQGTGTLDGEAVELFAVIVPRPRGDCLVIAAIKASAPPETRSLILDIVRSLRRG